MKIFTAGFIGLIVTGVLLLLMSQLINSDHQVVEKQKVVTLVDTPLPPEKQPKTNRLPKPQPPAVAPSAGEAVPLRASTIDTPDIPTVDFEPVDVNFPAQVIERQRHMSYWIVEVHCRCSRRNQTIQSLPLVKASRAGSYCNMTWIPAELCLILTC